MIGRDAADGQMRLTWLLKRLDIRWSRQGSTSRSRRCSSCRAPYAGLFCRVEGEAEAARNRPADQFMTRLSSPIESIEDHYDVVVVDSGYGGGRRSP
jgi:hypothetical protein